MSEVQGELIKLGDHEWRLPPVPTDKSKILFWDKPKEEQFWIRDNDIPQIFFDYNRSAIINAEETQYDEEGMLTHLSVADTELVADILDRELERRTFGIYFMNYGKPVYLTGGHYFMLQWGAMPDVENPNDGSCYPEFRWFQCYLHYFLKMCKDDRDCAGAFIGKPKKSGITNLIAIDLVEELTRHKEKYFGLMSENAGKCERTNLGYMLFTFDKLPAIFQPPVAKRNSRQFFLDTIKSKDTGTKRSAAKRIKSNEDAYGSFVFIGSTKAAFDAQVMFRIVLDELPKYKDPMPAEVWKANKETVKIATKIKGKIWCFAYPPEEDTESLEQAHEIWKQSDIQTKTDGRKRTISGLYQYYIPADEASEEHFDKYGVCNSKQVRFDIEKERERLKENPEDLLAYIRQYSLLPDEMWQEGGKHGSTFNNMRFGQRKKDLEKELTTHTPFVKGSLEWINPENVQLKGQNRRIDSLVKFVPQSEADLLARKEAPITMYEWDTIDDKFLNVPMKLKQSGKKRVLEPMDWETTPHYASWDPTDFLKKSMVKQGSMHAGAVFNFRDIAKDSLYGRPVTDIKICDYHFRNEDPEDDLENQIKMFLFFGCPIYIEANKGWMLTMLDNLDLTQFVVVRHATQGLTQYKPRVHTKLPTTTKDVIDDYVTRLKTYWKAPGPDESRADYMSVLQDVTEIKQHIHFDPTDTKKSDKVVCRGLGLILRDAMILKRIKNFEKNHKVGGNPLAAAMKGIVRPV